MQKNNFYISFGVWIVLIPLLGIPSIWKNYITFLSGLFLILVSVGPSLIKKLQVKNTTKKKTIKNISQEENSYKSEELTFNDQFKKETEEDVNKDDNK